MIILGIMSGTSCDGADVVALRLDSVTDRNTPLLLGHHYEPYPDELRDPLLSPEELSVADIARLHYKLGHFYLNAVVGAGWKEQAAVCGLHGQTIWHAPPSQRGPDAATLQIGCAAVVAEGLGIPVVSDLRALDLVLGGEGAPIVPFSHWFFSSPDDGRRVVVNVGGIANLTLVTPELNDVRAWDVGPGMMMVDYFVARATGGLRRFDKDGELSAGGVVMQPIVDRVLAHPFFARRPPKSTGREEFGKQFTDDVLQAKPPGARDADVIVSLIEATARGIAHAISPLSVGSVLITGGGARNEILISALERLLAPAQVSVALSGVFAPECHEPAAMALIAARTMAGLPSSLPAVTGARRAARLGQIQFP